jgi:cytochrome b
MRRPIRTVSQGRNIEPTAVDAVKVWDAPTRLFHWSIVALVAISWISADQGYMQVHLVSGISLLILLLFRIIWGVIGSTTARFTNFVSSPKAVLAYILPGEGAKPHYAGHNPAGGLMVLTLIGILLLQVTTGLFANDGVAFSGPLALMISSDISDYITMLHGYLFYAILALIWMHVVAVFFYFFVKRENLVIPMFTGFKRRHHLPDTLELQFTHSLKALLAVVLVVCFVRLTLF